MNIDTMTPDQMRAALKAITATQAANTPPPVQIETIRPGMTQVEKNTAWDAIRAALN